MPFMIKISTDTPRGGYGSYHKIGLVEVEPGTTHVSVSYTHLPLPTPPYV